MSKCRWLLPVFKELRVCRFEPPSSNINTITAIPHPILTPKLEEHANNNINPFDDDDDDHHHHFSDPLCKLNLKETAEFVRSFPVPNTSPTMPCTPGRPLFSFTTSSRRNTLPSKWEDAEKWVMGHESPAHHQSFTAKPSRNSHVLIEKSRVSVDTKLPKEIVPSFTKSCSALSASLDRHGFTNGTSSIIPFDGLLKDKFTNEVVQVLGQSGYSEEPTKEGFIFRKKKIGLSMKDAATEVVKHRDMGTEMTPLGSSTTSRCHTPIKCISPARHNTPENRSGPLTLIGANTANPIDMAQFQECHLAKLNLGKQFDSVTSNWSSREEEEEDVSKSLRHFEIDNGCRRSVSESRVFAWEEEDKTKSCLRYQREEAKIQAWLNLQTAKAEAQSRKLEVKIQKMRSNMEEKLMKKVATADRKAEEWRAEAQLVHSEQIRRATERTQKMMIAHKNTPFPSPTVIPISCGCFPCNTTHHF